MYLLPYKSDVKKNLAVGVDKGKEGPEIMADVHFNNPKRHDEAADKP